MTHHPDRSLSDLAESVAEEFEAYRDPDGFNELSLVIDTSDREYPTLIVRIDREQAAKLADRVEAFLCNHGARTERERHTEADIRVLATIE